MNILQCEISVIKKGNGTNLCSSYEIVNMLLGVWNMKTQQGEFKDVSNLSWPLEKSMKISKDPGQVDFKVIKISRQQDNLKG